jgi:ATP/maltotriose-dependent transcriptional regulator MalT
VTWLARAGEQSLAVFAPHDAIAYLQRADELADQFGQALPREAVRMRGRAREMVGEFDNARADYEQALQLARSERDGRGEWQALLDLGGLWAERDYERAGEAMRQALVLARQELEETAVAHSLNAIGNWHLNHDEPLTALNFHQEALEIFARRDDQQGVAATSDLLALAQFVAGDVRGAADRYARVVELLEEVDERRLLSSALANWAATGGYFETDAVAVADGSLDHWLGKSARARAIAREIGWADGQAYAEILAGAMLELRGEMSRAMDLASAGMSLAEQIGHRQWMVCGHVALGRIHADVFDVAAARPHLEAALSLSEAIASPLWTALAVANLTLLLIDIGELDTAESIQERVLAADRPAVSTAQRCCRLSRAQLLLARGEPEQALRVIDALIETAPNGADLRSLPWIALARGQTLIALDRIAEATAALVAAQFGARNHGYSHLLWRSNLSLVELFRQSGRTWDAHVALADARGVVDEIANTLPSTTQRDAFLAVIRRRCSGFAYPTESPRAVAGLTPRELEVLRLVAAGLSDAEVGLRLSIARRTVGRHLESIYNKLGVGSRTAAAAFAFEHGLMAQERD